MLFLLLVSAVCPAVRGDEKRPAFSAAAAVKTITPFVDDDVIAVAHLDAVRAAAGNLFDVSGRFIPAGHALARLNLAASLRLESFLKAGGRELYVIVSAADLPEPGPFVLVPLQKGADEKALRALAGDAFVERVGDVLFIGEQETRRRLAANGPAARPELACALESVAGSQAQIAFIPNTAARRVVEELLPTLPIELGGGPTTTLTRGALWAALGVDSTPDLTLRFVAQSESRDAARVLQRHLEKLSRDRLQKSEKLMSALRPKATEDRLSLTLHDEKLGEVAAALRPLADEAAGELRRRQSTNQLKQIGLALHTYLDAHEGFPPAAIAAAQGRPLLSWRVAILPFLDQEPLYKQFHLDEPWDSEHNRNLIERMPDVFRSFASAAPSDRTSFVVATGPGTVFDGVRGIKIGEITDGTSNTLLAWETDDEHAVVWTKPDDVAFDSEQPSAHFASAYPDGRLLLFCDGSVQFIKPPLDDEAIRRLVIRNDGKPLSGLR